MPMMFEGYYGVDIDITEPDVKADGWISCPEIHLDFRVDIRIPSFEF